MLDLIDYEKCQGRAFAYSTLLIDTIPKQHQFAEVSDIR